MTNDILKTAEAYCGEKNLAMTAPRRAVLKIIAAAKKPLGAYDVLERLGRVLTDPKPPTAYRALSFWQAHGFIHRIESLNAYLACHAGHRHNGAQYMICDSCGAVTEAHVCDLPDALSRQAGNQKFTITHWSAELRGLCAKCKQKSGTDLHGADCGD